MTRKRFMKLMMGRGVSRNRAREIVKTMREMRETETKVKHFLKAGELEKALKAGKVYEILKIQMTIQQLIASAEERRYKEISNI